MRKIQGKLEEECVNWNEIKDLPEDKLDIWPVPTGHKVEAIKINGKYVLIDLNISGLIQALNSAGYKTLFCCSGHEDNHYRGYIMFENTKENIELLGRVVVEFLSGEDESEDDQFSLELDRRGIIRFYPNYPDINKEKYLVDITNLFIDCL